MTRANRPKLRPEQWPNEDRARWQRATKAGDLFDDAASASHFSESTKRAFIYEYCCFLGFLKANHPRLLDQAPPARVRPEIIAQYIQRLRETNRETSVAAELAMLRHMLRVLCPEADWNWLLGVIKRIAAKATPKPASRAQLVTSADLYALGVRLMAEASAAVGDSIAPAKSLALQYRDGLLIALLAVIPLRRRTLAAIEIGRQLVKVDEIWLLDIPPEDTKTRHALEYPLGKDLSNNIDEYLKRFRPCIPGALDHNGLWASNKAQAMDDSAIYDRVRRRTKSAFGFPINLHRFRSAGATLWALYDPTNVRGIKDLLGHSGFSTATETHYIKAKSRLAGRALASCILDLPPPN